MPNEMEELEFYLKKAKQVVYEVKKTVVGKDEAICKLLMAILAKGHILIEDIPGSERQRWRWHFQRHWDWNVTGCSLHRILCRRI